ncbi:HyaD/HybD family hydrogenase maturation endopeptidase [Paraferrimonas sedimenticola]|uniref:HybD peptidase n=1 Tax=Paraferrimonas sedimenticola TaxID=375674 RepID=A0AA37RU80_9GAMM|nr:HyaD/HybD family hydrogenase maturation endopeptidase [Paraferrimonas sedimenticola]GLP95610.1 HybD peptidase [Paraferrimonas sedimenticola]
MTQSKRILVLGIGNLLYGDEGIGVHMVQLLKRKYRFSGASTLDIVDGGTLAHALIPLIAQYDHLIVIDTVNANNARPGEVYWFDFDKAPSEVDWQGSAHEVEMLQTLNMMDMVGDRPPTFVLGVVPKVIDSMSFELSTPVREAVPTMERTLLNYLNCLQVEHQLQQELSIDQVSASAAHYLSEEHEQAEIRI